MLVLLLGVVPSYMPCSTKILTVKLPLAGASLDSHKVPPTDHSENKILTSFLGLQVGSDMQ